MTKEQVSKHYDYDCLQNFLLVFKSLFKAPIVENSHVLDRIYFTFKKKRPRPNLNGTHYQTWPLMKRSEKQVSSRICFITFNLKFQKLILEF